jgi:hypothetical protein
MSRFHKSHRIFWVSKWLVASQEGFFAQWSYLYQELNVYFNIRRERLLIYLGLVPLQLQMLRIVTFCNVSDGRNLWQVWCVIRLIVDARFQAFALVQLRSWFFWEVVLWLWLQGFRLLHWCIWGLGSSGRWYYVTGYLVTFGNFRTVQWSHL